MVMIWPTYEVGGSCGQGPRGTACVEVGEVRSPVYPARPPCADPHNKTKDVSQQLNVRKERELHLERESCPTVREIMVTYSSSDAQQPGQLLCDRLGGYFVPPNL